MKLTRIDQVNDIIKDFLELILDIEISRELTRENIPNNFYNLESVLFHLNNIRDTEYEMKSKIKLLQEIIKNISSR